MPNNNKRSEPDKPRSARDLFVDFSKATSQAVGSHWAFLIAILVIAVWAITGPMFRYSDNWQLVINTGTTIVTFLMVFLIQSTQNRDAKAIHLKLDELIRALRGARDDLVLLENMSEDELERLAGEFQNLHDHACKHMQLRKGQAGAKVPASS
jgi:low affinity Fe/Cu permease